MIETWAVYVKYEPLVRWFEVAEFTIKDIADQYAEMLRKSHGDDNVEVRKEHIYETMEEVMKIDEGVMKNGE